MVKSLAMMVTGGQIEQRLIYLERQQRNHTTEENLELLIQLLMDNLPRHLGKIMITSKTTNINIINTMTRRITLGKRVTVAVAAVVLAAAAVMTAAPTAAAAAVIPTLNNIYLMWLLSSIKYTHRLNHIWQHSHTATARLSG